MFVKLPSLITKSLMASSAVGFTFKLTMRAEHRSHRFTVGPRPAELNTASFKGELNSHHLHHMSGSQIDRSEYMLPLLPYCCHVRQGDEMRVYVCDGVTFPWGFGSKLSTPKHSCSFGLADSDEQLSCASNSLAKVNGTRMSLNWDGRLFARGDQEKVQYGPVWYWFISQVDWFETQSIHCWRSIFNLLVLS